VIDMPSGYHKKPLGAWPDDKKHQATQSPDETGEQSISGSMPDPEQISNMDDQDKAKDTLDRAKEAGVYHQYDEENQGELGLAEEENEDLAEEEEIPEGR
jgi:hypothetical protein